MFLVLTYVLMSLLVAFLLLGVVALLTREPKVARMSFLASGVLFGFSVLGLIAASLWTT